MQPVFFVEGNCENFARMRILPPDLYAPESWFTKVMPGLRSVGGVLSSLSWSVALAI